MNKFFISISLFLSLFTYNISYSQADSIPTTKNTFLKKSIVPLSLIGAGIYVNFAGGSLGKVSL